VRIRDPIHNFVELPDDLAWLVDSRPLQRLRGIRQLAFANLVYPGALHTRFDHTMGVTHVARQMSEVLGVKGEELRLITLAALLHDVGHGPFSHVSEASLDWFGDRSKLPEAQKQHKIHEAVTERIIESDIGLGNGLTAEERDQVVKLLGEGTGRPVLKQIVSGPLDADKQDYLLRDGNFCGVQYGRFDLAQLHRSLVLPDPEAEMMIDSDGTHAVEQFVLAKYYMTANVYRHRVRLITDQMITRGIRLGVDVDKLESMNKLYRFDGTDEFIRNYSKWDDARFMETFCPADGPGSGSKCDRMLRKLRERKLLKEVFRDPIAAPYDARCWETLKGLHKRDSVKLAKAVEGRVAEFLNSKLGLTGDRTIDADFVIGHSYGIKSARESSRNDENGILVNVKPGPQPFTDVSTLFRSINEAFNDNFIVLFAPIDWPDPQSKETLRANWKEPIRQMIIEEWKRPK